MTSRRIDHHRVCVTVPLERGAQAVQVRNALITWTQRPTNAAQLLSHVPPVTENDTSDGFTFTFDVRYRTHRDDGDGHDIRKAATRALAAAIPSGDWELEIEGVAT